MNRAVIIIVGLIVPLVFIFSICAEAQDADSLIKSGDELWLKRAKSDQNVTDAIKLYEQAAQSDPKNETAWLDIARAYYFLGRFASKEKKDELFGKGIEAAKKALALNAGGVGGNYWYVVNLSKSIEEKAVTTKMKYMSDIKKHIDAAVKADPTYYFGGPYRVAGMLSFKSPLGSNKDAIDYLRKSLEIAPEYSLTLLNLGEVLIREKQYDEAKKVLEKTLAVTARPGFEREVADDQAQARKLLASLTK